MVTFLGYDRNYRRGYVFLVQFMHREIARPRGNRCDERCGFAADDAADAASRESRDHSDHPTDRPYNQSIRVEKVSKRIWKKVRRTAAPAKVDQLIHICATAEHARSAAASCI